MKEPAVEIKDLSISIGGARILEAVSFSVDEREYLSIIGPNGAGKTTILKCLMRIYPNWTGTVKVAGIPIDAMSQKELAGRISYVPQSEGRSVPFTVGEMVVMGRYPHLSPFTSIKPVDREAVEQALEMTGTSGIAERRFNTLSGGEKQMVLIASALAQGAGIMLLDEPTTFLDPKHEEDIQRVLATVNRTLGITILNVTHDINSAALNGDRVVILKNGRVIYDGDSESIITNELLEGVYDRRFMIHRHPRTGQPVIAPDIIEP